MRYLILLALFLAGAAQAATLEVTITPTTKDNTGGNLPATGLGALTGHRVEVGSCSGANFGTQLQQKSVAMPGVKVTFINLPAQLLCVRAFPANAFGEGTAYPISLVGPLPNGEGSITVLTVTP